MGKTHKLLVTEYKDEDHYLVKIFFSF